MLEKYKEEQPQIYQLLDNSIKLAKYSHGYLFDINNYDYANNFIKDFIKDILNDSNINKKIDDDILDEIKIIEPDGNIIKKEQILKLHEFIKTKPIIIKKKICIIKEAEKMNKYAVNSLLKVLEEPPKDCLFFLITNNTNKIPSTIPSRLQLIHLNKVNRVFNYLIEEFIENNQKKIDEIKEMIAFLSFIETNKIEQIFSSNYYINWFSKEDIIVFLDLIIFIYNKISIIKTTNQYYEDIDLIKDIININNKEQLIKKIKITIDLKSKIEYNMNDLLLRDYLIIKLKEVF